MRAVAGLLLAIALCGCGGGSGSPAAPSNQSANPGGGSSLPSASTQFKLSIAVATPDSSISQVQVSVSPVAGGAATLTAGACGSGSCTITVASSADYSIAQITLVTASGAVRNRGTVYVDPSVNKTLSVSVIFGAQPATVQLSVEPSRLESGTQSTGELSIMAFDAQGRQLIGMPFPAPVTVAAAGDTTKLTLSGTQFTSPEDKIAFTFDGSPPGHVMFTPSISGVLGAVDLKLVLPAHFTANGHATGDGKPGSIRRRASVAAAPANPPPLANAPTAVNPQKVDLSANLPPTGDQGAQNSCGAWATTYAIRSYFEQLKTNWGLTGNGPGGINTAHVFSPAFMYNAIDGGVDKGLIWLDVAKFLLNNGAVSWDVLPYNQNVFTPVPPAADFSSALAFRVATVYDIKLTDLALIKTYLAAGYPVFWGADVDDAFDKITAASPVWQPDFKNLDGHGLTLVGYDDTQAQFIFRNSWGTGFGVNGNGFVSYADFLNPKLTNTLYVFVP